LERAERLANAPVVVLAGQLSAAWTPSCDNSFNPYYRDDFNILTGGVALALRWNFDPAKARAKTAAAVARRAQVGGPKSVRNLGGKEANTS